MMLEKTMAEEKNALVVEDVREMNANLDANLMQDKAQIVKQVVTKDKEQIFEQVSKEFTVNPPVRKKAKRDEDGKVMDSMGKMPKAKDKMEMDHVKGNDPNAEVIMGYIDDGLPSRTGFGDVDPTGPIQASGQRQQQHAWHQPPHLQHNHPQHPGYLPHQHLHQQDQPQQQHQPRNPGHPQPPQQQHREHHDHCQQRPLQQRATGDRGLGPGTRGQGPGAGGRYR